MPYKNFLSVFLYTIITLLLGKPEGGLQLNKIVELLKKIPTTYYNWKQRNEKLNNFLESCKNNADKLNNIDKNVTHLKQELNVVKDEVDSLEKQINQVNGRLETIGAGTKMELFDTLHNWRIILVVEKGWASPAEKREVEEIYRIYHDGLKGNGQGEKYYKEIMALPESEEELQMRR